MYQSQCVRSKLDTINLMTRGKTIKELTKMNNRSHQTILLIPSQLRNNYCWRGEGLDYSTISKRNKASWLKMLPR